MMTNNLNVYIGWDYRESEAWFACSNSILTNTRNPKVHINKIDVHTLENNGLYNRKQNYPDEVAATDFSFSRFLTPYLNNNKGWAVFCDCDFIWTEDVTKLFDLADDKYSVMCVKHDYTPKSEMKMDGQMQTKYPMKNWSSMMLINCGHPDCKNLTPESVSNESGAWLHQMKWTTQANIGEVPATWNWLVGEYEKIEGNTPSAIHYTLGCPFMEGYENCDFAEVYRSYL